MKRPYLIAALLWSPWHGSVAATAAPPLPTSAARETGTGSWWARMGDDAMIQLIERALAANTSIAQASARLAQAQAAGRAIRASQLPSLGAGASATAARQSLEDPVIRPFADLPGFPRDFERYEGSLSASWEVDLFGAAPRRRAARAQEAAAAADLAAMRVAIAAETATVWINVRELRARHALAQARVGSLQRQQAALRLRADAGTLAPLQFDQSEAELASAAAAVPVLGALATAETERLGVLVADAGFARSLAASRGDWAPSATVLPDALPVSLEARPDVVAAAYRLAAADAGVAAAHAQRLPVLSLGAVLATVTAAPAALFTASALARQAGAGVSLPLFDFGRIDASIAQARGQRLAALAAYREAILIAAADVESATALLASRREEARQQATAKAASLRARTAAATTLAAGAMDLVEFLAIERRYIASREADATAEAAYLRSIIALRRATAI